VIMSVLTRIFPLPALPESGNDDNFFAVHQQSSGSTPSSTSGTVEPGGFFLLNQRRDNLARSETIRGIGGLGL
jgi:hypothetical protein